VARHDDVRTVTGELTDGAALRSALEGCDAVISALGPMEMWEKKTVIANAYRVVIDAMRAQGVKRLIALATPSVLDPADQRGLKALAAVFVTKNLASGAYQDIITTGDVIANADDIEWTIVRVPFLLNGTGNETAKGYVGDGNVGWFLNRAGFARFVVEELEEREWVRRRPALSSV
jgi:putative NADH-flavin reductase